MPRHHTPSLRDGFRCVPADNGGWLLHRTDGYDPGMRVTNDGAFSNATDMLHFLAQELGVLIPLGIHPNG